MPPMVMPTDPPSLTVEAEGWNVKSSVDLSEYVPQEGERYVAVCAAGNEWVALPSAIGENPPLPDIPADHELVAIVYLSSDTKTIIWDYIVDCRLLPPTGIMPTLRRLWSAVRIKFNDWYWRLAALVTRIGGKGDVSRRIP
jgi:hypothetical protein